MKHLARLPLFSTWAILSGLLFIGPLTSFAATAPSLGTAETFGVISSTFTNSNTVPQSIITGDVCYTTAPVTPPLSISGAVTTPCDPDLGSSQVAALADINGQLCVSLGSGAVDLDSIVVGLNPPGTFPPGCYSSGGAMNITVSTSITLNGLGVFIFKPTGALTTGANSSVLLTGGANAADVFWAPIAAATLGANAAPSITPTFIGTIIDAAGVSLGHFANLTGRILTFGGTVTTDANTITVPSASSLATLRVIKQVVNTSGGSATAASFSLHVKLTGSDVSGSPQIGAASPGTSYTLAADTYIVSEDTFSGYAAVFSGDCDATGSVTLIAGGTKTCTITNTDSPATLRIIKEVINTGGGSAVPLDFTLHVKTAGSDVTGSPQVGVVTPGTSYTLSAGSYTVSEDANSSYSPAFSGDCNSSGVVALSNGESKSCTITNTYIVVTPPAALSSSFVGAGTSYFLPAPTVATSTQTQVLVSAITLSSPATSSPMILAVLTPMPFLATSDPLLPNTGLPPRTKNNLSAISIILGSLFLIGLSWTAVKVRA